MSYISSITKGDLVLVWERDEEGNRVEQIYDAPFYFYVDDPAGDYRTIYDTPVTKLVFKNSREYYNTRKNVQEMGLKMWESDIPADLRVISRHYYGQPSPKMNITFLDIENDYNEVQGYASIKNPYAPINAISLFHVHRNELMALSVPPPGQEWTEQELYDACNAIVPFSTEYKTIIKIFKTEREMLQFFIDDIHDSDILAGWNSERFDIPYIAKRLGISLGDVAFKRLSFPNAHAPQWREATDKHQQTYEVLELSGRISFDYLELYRKYEVEEKASYKLAAIEEEVELNLPKLEYPGTLHGLYHGDFAYFVRYNIRDSEILRGFELTLGYVDVACQMYHLSGASPKHVQGTLKLAEYAITNYCHRELDRVVPNVTRPDIDRQIEGALVLWPQVGLHRYFGSIDINSLYPSAIRSLNMSPETIIGQFIETERAQEAIARNDSDVFLSLQYEAWRNDGETIIDTKTASEWREILLKNRWAVSGYGTVFDQNTDGIIPTILTNWFATRKQYQAELRDKKSQMKALLAKYDIK